MEILTIFIAILLSLLTLGFIVYPLVRPRGPVAAVRKPAARKSVAAPTSDDAVDDEIEARVKALRQAPAGFCTGCGASLKAGDRFCQRCGQRVN